MEKEFKPISKEEVLKVLEAYFSWKEASEKVKKLTEISGIEYKSISQHLFYRKTEQKTLTEIDYTPQELYNIPVKEPPWQKMITTREYPHKIGSN